jgi:hypothetical protein
MPGFDGTGLMGLGPMTGRGMGYCAVRLPVNRGFVPPYGYAGFYGNLVALPYPVPARFMQRGMPFREGYGRRFGMRHGRGRFMPAYCF